MDSTHLFYVRGRGLGHLTRISQFVKFLNIRGRVFIVGDEPFGARIFPSSQGFEYLLAPVDPGTAGRWLKDNLDKIIPEYFYTDVFPSGIYGEIEDFVVPDHCYRIHTARNLKFSVLKETLSGVHYPVKYHSTYVFEELEDEHRKYLDAHSRMVWKVGASYDIERVERSELPEFCRDPFHLVVHSGPQSEVIQLIEMARSADLDGKFKCVVCTPFDLSGLHYSRMEEFHFIDYFPANHFFPHAEMIFTGAGFNCIHEINQMGLKAKHISIPFDRALDNQLLRHEKYRRKNL